MQTLTFKLRHIYLPSLAMAIGFIALYTFLDWALFIKLDLLPIKQEVLIAWFAMFLPFVPVVIWLRPRIKLLRLADGPRGGVRGLYYIVAGLLASAPTMILQDYLYRTSGEMVRLENINEITAAKNAKFYTLDNFYMDKQNAAAHAVTFDTKRRNDWHFNMFLYIAVPIWEKHSDSIHRECTAWLGVEYSNRISNVRVSEEEKQRAFREFVMKSERDFQEKDLGRFAYLARPGHTDADDGFHEAMKKSPKYDGKNTIVLVPMSNAFEERGGALLRVAATVFGIGALIWFVMLLFPKIDRRNYRRFKSGATQARQDKEFRELRMLLVPSKNYPASMMFIYINVLLYIAMVVCGLGFMSFRTQDLLAWGANSGALVGQGEWWRLLTSTFLHGGFAHIVANMYGLFFMGMLMLEPLIGRLRFAIAYMTCGILASCASIIWNPNGVSVGASGAIFGICGVLLVLMLTKTIARSFNKSLLTNVLIFVGINLLFGFVIPEVDNAAHLGGLLAGIVIGLVFSFLLPPHQQKNTRNRKGHADAC